MLDCLELLHFHIGSQISAIRAIKDAMKEASRIYVELAKAGAGSAVPRRGRRAGRRLRRLADQLALVHELHDAGVRQRRRGGDPGGLREAGVPHPGHRHRVGPRAGRAPLGAGVQRPRRERGAAGQAPPDGGPGRPAGDPSSWSRPGASISRKNFQEAYHDALQLKEEATRLFNVGLLDLRGRARVEQLFWGCCEAILKIIRELDYVPDDLEGLEKGLADTYYGNFSVFQSVPDHWAVKQLFPILPLHRLNERPTRRAVSSPT